MRRMRILLFNVLEAVRPGLAAIRHKPSDTEASILAQCTMEGPFGTIETLLTNVQVHITGSRKFSTNSAGGFDGEDDNRKDMSNRADVLVLTGYAKQYACGEQSFSPGKNCTMTEMPNSPAPAGRRRMASIAATL